MGSVVPVGVCVGAIVVMAPKKQVVKPKKGAGKKVAPTPAVLLAVDGKKKKEVKKQKEEKVQNPLFVPRPRDGLKPKRPWAKRDLTRFTKWPKYIVMQRQKSLLLQRLKVPPSIHQFHKEQCLNSNQAKEVLSLLHKYRPETKKAKLIRLKKQATKQASGEDVVLAKSPVYLQQGVHKVVTQVTQKKAKLVVISHDVDPIEVVLFLPALCRKMGIPYCILKSKARLGALVRRKTCAAVCLNDVEDSNKSQLNKVIESVKASFNDRFDDIRKTWGGGVLSRKAEARKNRIEKAKLLEQKKAEKAGVAK